MKLKKAKREAMIKYLRVLSLLFVIAIEVFIGVALLTNSHASSIYTIPDNRNATDPNVVIDPSGVKDSTAGLQAYLDSIPNGTSGNNNTVLFPAGAKYRVNGGLTISHNYTTFTTDSKNPAQIFADGGVGPQAYPWRVRPTSSNVDGRQSNWFMDEYKDVTNHATLGSHSCTGCGTGGYDGYLTGYQNDASVGDATSSTAFGLGSYNQHVFKSSDLGKAITACTAFGCMNRIISSVMNCPVASYDSSSCSAKGDSNNKFNAVFWDASQAKQADKINMSSNGWVSWAINSAKGGWECYFTPNPNLQPKDYSGSFNDYNNATRCATDNNRSRTLVTINGSFDQITNMQFYGSNTTWAQTVENFDNAEPTVTEFQHDIILSGSNNEIANNNIDDANGDGVFFQGKNEWLHNNQIHRTGRQGMALSNQNSQIIIESNVVQDTHHSAIDVEPNGGGSACEEDWISIINNTFGANHGIAMNPGRSACFSHIKFSGNHSTNQDVASGSILGTTGWQRTTSWGSTLQSKYIIFTNNVTDSPAIFPLGFNNMSHIYIDGNAMNFTAKRPAYFFLFKNSTDYQVTSNNVSRCGSACGMKGLVDPSSTQAASSFTFSPPGKPDADSWWAHDGPDPSNYYRDRSTPPPVDTAPPTTPTGLSVSSVATQYVKLVWSASTDNVGVDHYNIYRSIGLSGNQSRIATTKSTQYTDIGVIGGNQYVYQISAVDAAGNESTKSSTVSANVPAPPLFKSGDLNQDGKVDILDMSLLIDSYGKSGSNIGRADINHDNKVDILDMSLLIDQYGK